MHVLSSYIEKQDFYCPHVDIKANASLNLIIVIPCYDEDTLFDTLNSVLNCDKPDSTVEVIVVINHPDDAADVIKQKHEELFIQCCNWTKEHSDSQLSFYFLYAANLRKKYAGVGWARKIGMDEAVYRFSQMNNEEGIICSLDADVTIDQNYLVKIEEFFSKYKKAEACSIYFEHDFEGDKFEPVVYESIKFYELYLRYYLEGLRNSGYPYAYHTIGSCFAVKAASYAKQGGMSKRQGGEDFYFLHKIIPHGNFYELNTTCVHPSSRPSHRVPFGTGPTISRYMNIEDKANNIKTVSLRAFHDLKNFFSLTDQLFGKPIRDYFRLLSGMSETIITFLSDIEFEIVLKNFRSRFYHNFNALVILKFLNHAHQNFYKQKPLLEEVQELLRDIYKINCGGKVDEMLKLLRKIQREGVSTIPLQ